MARYNGWRNYPTWATNLWIQNDEATYRYWSAKAQEIYNQERIQPGHPQLSTLENARIALERALKEEHAERIPRVSGLWMDLVLYAFEHIYWSEVALALLETTEKDEP